MRNIASTILITALAATVLAGCGLRDRDGETGLAPLSPEEAALTAVGYDAKDVGEGDEAAPAAQVTRRERLLHGEVVVQTDAGTRTVLVQRGEVTDIADTTVTVVSSDGFEQTWTYGDVLRVIESRRTIEPREISIGARVGVAGHERAGTPVANLIVIPAR